MQKRLLVAPVAMSLLLGLAPAASATRWLVVGSGQTSAGLAVGGQTFLPGVPLAFQTVNFGIEIDGGVAGASIPAPFGIGEGARFAGAVESFNLFVGPYTITAKPGSPRAIIAYDNVPGGVPPTPVRIDQLTYSNGVDFSSGFNPHILLDPAVGAGLSITSLTFGRTLVGSEALPPTMLNGTAFPYLPDLWKQGVPMLFSFEVRQGTATDAAGLRALPVVRFNTSIFALSVIELPDAGPVPEPATWALFIAGFGLVGCALRNRRTTPGATLRRRRALHA